MLIRWGGSDVHELARLQEWLEQLPAEVIAFPASALSDLCSAVMAGCPTSYAPKMAQRSGRGIDHFAHLTDG